jgi:hypothetical protein
VSLRLACLSPEEIQISVTVGYLAAAFGIAATTVGIGLSLYRRDFTWLPFYALLLAFHPAWTISVYRGDCGDARRFLSGVASLVFVALLLVQTFRPQLSRQRFLLAISALAWLLYLPLFLSFALQTPFLPNDDFVGHIIMAYTMSSHDIAHIAVALSAACVVFWFASRLHGRRRTV